MILEDDSQIIKTSTGAASQEIQLRRAAKTLQALYLMYISHRLVSRHGDHKNIMLFHFDLCENGKPFFKSDRYIRKTSSLLVFGVRIELYQHNFEPGGKYDANDIDKLMLFFRDDLNRWLGYLKKFFPDVYQEYYEGHYLYFRRDLIVKQYKEIDELL